MGIQIDNPLGTQKVSSLLHRFALPSIVAMLVSSLYNIVDQFFIGHSVGELGNAATNISFPLSISCVAIALLFGIGGSSAFNISKAYVLHAFAASMAYPLCQYGRARR